MEKLKNNPIQNQESWPGLFGISEAEVLEVMQAARTYSVGGQSYKDWCVMYSGIHRESTMEATYREWLACYRWMKTKSFDIDALLKWVEERYAISKESYQEADTDYHLHRNWGRMKMAEEIIAMINGMINEQNPPDGNPVQSHEPLAVHSTDEHQKPGESNV